LFYDRVVHDLRAKLGKAQTGYTYSCYYHLVTLHEIARDRLTRGLWLIVMLGDLIGAFPKAWRALLATLAGSGGRGPPLEGSRLVLFAELLENSSVQVTNSGQSLVNTPSGLGEGGVLGPLDYPLIPAVLSDALDEQDLGVGADITEEDATLMAKLDPFREEHGGQFAEIDRRASFRVPLLLQADDQALLAGSLATLRILVEVAEAWSICVRQEFHIGEAKTVVFLIGLGVPRAGSTWGIRLYGHLLANAVLHKWLGVWWDGELNFRRNWDERVGAARSALRPILALAREGAVPLAEAREAPRAKVSSALFYGEPFLYLVEGAAAKLDELQI
jgi:hypothetical protein